MLANMTSHRPKGVTFTNCASVLTAATNGIWSDMGSEFITGIMITVLISGIIMTPLDWRPGNAVSEM